ncbi:hypothetical protein BJY52DRAFT_1303067 [Lactarius psammicola]|nr:hypothetical protein BJY52DRAFT_1303067 [Lactarius psammicola]
MSFISPEDRAYMSPSSSPGGSPSTSSVLDSSPLSSPSLQPLDLNRPPTPPGISHPFAGSTHATKHPSHELRYTNSSYTPASWAYRPGVSSSADHSNVLEDIFREEENFSQSELEVEPPDEATLWEEKITRAVDTGEAEFTWKDAGLTFVPPSIMELNSLGVVTEPTQRPFKRVQTAPAVFSSPHRSLFAHPVAPSRTRSQGLMIFLANNEIKTLPPEFFGLSNLTVLSLRNNSLEYLPPEIVQLHALKDLDVVNNNLHFLPAEMTTMTFTNLKVHTNPWHPDPANPAAREGPKTVDAATRVHFRVPPLREVVLRYLLTPSSTSQQRTLVPHPTVTTMSTTARTRRQPTTLEDRFLLPLQDGALSPADAALFARVAPAAVSAPRRHAFSRATTTSASAGMFSSAHVKAERRERGLSAVDAAGAAQEQKSFGRCPSPRHCGVSPAPAAASSAGSAAMAWARLGPPFVLPAEERYTWVTEIAGVRVGETTGGVPLLWRGCGRGCLDFLNAAGGAPASEEN